MEKILAKFFGFLKYLLLIAAFGLTFFGIMKTYSRLDKSLFEAFDVFLPFALVLIMFMVNLFVKNKHVNDNLFFNFVSCLAFSVMILVGVRSLFDTNMVLWSKYNIDFNPAYFADNISLIQALLYMVFASNVVLFVCGLLDTNKNKKVIANKENKKVVKKDDESKDE